MKTPSPGRSGRLGANEQGPALTTTEKRHLAPHTQKPQVTPPAE